MLGISTHLSGASLPNRGDCSSLEGREAELGGKVLCSVLEQSRQAVQIYRWGVFATGDHGGWLLLSEGQHGWNVTDSTSAYEKPNW